MPFTDKRTTLKTPGKSGEDNYRQRQTGRDQPLTVRCNLHIPFHHRWPGISGCWRSYLEWSTLERYRHPLYQSS